MSCVGALRGRHTRFRRSPAQLHALIVAFPGPWHVFGTLTFKHRVRREDVALRRLAAWIPHVDRISGAAAWARRKGKPKRPPTAPLVTGGGYQRNGRFHWHVCIRLEVQPDPNLLREMETAWRWGDALLDRYDERLPGLTYLLEHEHVYPRDVVLDLGTT